MLHQRYATGSRVALAALMSAAVALVSANASAQQEAGSAAEMAAARALAVDGLKLAQAGNCTEATPKLERAEKLHHSAIVLGRLGECYVEQGRLVEGTEMLRKVLREPQPADAPPAHVKAMERAKAALDAAKPRIASLTIKIPAVTDLNLKVDGRSVPAAMVDTEIPSDPGEHTIEATAPGFLKTSARVTLGAGDTKSVSLNLTRDPYAVTPPAPAPKASEGARDAEPKPSTTPAWQPEQPHNAPPPAAPNRTAAYVSWGLGALGVGVGSVFGVMTMQRKDELNDVCGSDCPASSSESLDSAKRLGNISTIAFGVGATGLALGTVLFFTAGSGSEEHAGRPAKPTRFAGLSNPRAALGPTSIQLGADF